MSTETTMTPGSWDAVKDSLRNVGHYFDEGVRQHPNPDDPNYQTTFMLMGYGPVVLAADVPDPEMEPPQNAFTVYGETAKSFATQTLEFHHFRVHWDGTTPVG